MADLQQGWKDAADRLSALALKLKLTYQEEREGDAGQGLRDALGRLSDAVGNVFEAVEAAAKDEAIREDARQTATSVRDALANAFGQVGDDLRDSFNRRKPDSGE